MIRFIKKIILYRIEPIVESVKFIVFTFFRKNKKMESLKQIYKGKRCFIVCNGPSLSIEDLNFIKDEYSFTMNSVIKKLDLTEWRPTFYGIQDINVYENMPEEIMNLNCCHKFVCKEAQIKGLPIPDNAVFFDLFAAGHYATNPNPKFKFSHDVSVCVYDGYSISYSLLQIAVYLGFNEIYLLGCDCSYSKEPSQQHFADSGHVDPYAYVIGGLQIRAYEKAKQVCDSLGVKVYNATRGGALEVFPRVNLKNIIQK